MRTEQPRHRARRIGWQVMASCVAVGLLLGSSQRRGMTVGHLDEPEDRPSQGALVVAERLLGNAREELNRADTKASILMAAAAALIAGVVAGVMAGDGRRRCSPVGESFCGG